MADGKGAMGRRSSPQHSETLRRRKGSFAGVARSTRRPSLRAAGFATWPQPPRAKNGTAPALRLRRAAVGETVGLLLGRALAAHAGRRRDGQLGAALPPFAGHHHSPSVRSAPAGPSSPRRTLLTPRCADQKSSSDQSLARIFGGTSTSHPLT
jgi:hypothetical protein